MCCHSTRWRTGFFPASTRQSQSHQSSCKDLLPLTLSDLEGLPLGCSIVGSRCSRQQFQAHLQPWRQRASGFDLLLLLAATRTAEREGISAAGATAASRRLTALALSLIHI